MGGDNGMILLVLSRLGEALHALLTKAADVFLSPGSVFWAPTLLSALLIAVGCLAATRIRRGRRVRPAALLRALFPRRILRGASSKADLGLLLFNTFPAGALVGWMLVSTNQVSRQATSLLGWALGPSAAIPLRPDVLGIVVTVTLFLAYELAYWLDHYLSHKVPFLWEFHKVHHTAQVLTPLTIFRVHPVDSLVFANIIALVVGATGGTLQYVFGASAAPFALSGTNVILLAFFCVTLHLQHSHLWISFTGALGRILLSPAHHQIHHSADPLHFNTNLGCCLSVFDWLFGTLHMPAARREPLAFGAATRTGASPHSVSGTLITPFTECLARLPALRRPQAQTSA